MNVYVDNILLASNMIEAFEELKNLLAKEYKIKDLGKVKNIVD